jgi:hypothetical protein
MIPAHEWVNGLAVRDGSVTVWPVGGVVDVTGNPRVVGLPDEAAGVST